nr:MAG TPA: hypothetical protein [Caudoviricetes sp.]
MKESLEKRDKFRFSGSNTGEIKLTHRRYIL